MNRNEYELVSEVQDRHWWWLGRERIMETLIERFLNTTKKLRIADVGCGFGANIPLLRRYGDVTGLELNKQAIDAVKAKWGASVRAVRWRSPDPLAMRFDLMLLADVLEHIPDDEAAVDWIYAHLDEGGYSLITVPAQRIFWTQMDEVLHHCRRYSKASLKGLFDERFEIVYCSYYNMLLFPAKAGFVLFDRIKRKLFPSIPLRSYNDLPPWFINSLFKHILMAECSVLGRTTLPFGVSLICLVRKKTG